MGNKGVGERCTYCRRILESTTSRGTLQATKDHVHPRSLGGSRKVWCCRLCNNLKGNMTAEEWSNFMAAHSEWWRTYGRTGIRLRERHKYRKPPDQSTGSISET